MMLVSQLHLFSILALFPAFLHAPPVLRAFDFPAHVAARPPTIVAFMLFQVRPCAHPGTDADTDAGACVAW